MQACSSGNYIAEEAFKNSFVQQSPPFAESQLYTDVEPFEFREGKTSVAWSDIACMNSRVESLVYGIESNFYDTNQNYIGMRLTTLKYSLIGPEYWVRFKHTNTTFKVEKSSY